MSGFSQWYKKILNVWNGRLFNRLERPWVWWRLLQVISFTVNSSTLLEMYLQLIWTWGLHWDDACHEWLCGTPVRFSNCCTDILVIFYACNFPVHTNSKGTLSSISHQGTQGTEYDSMARCPGISIPLVCKYWNAYRNWFYHKTEQEEHLTLIKKELYRVSICNNMWTLVDTAWSVLC